ncbi:MAG: mannose-6-phosphate isomerase [Algoriphagus sp.]|jgi:mannose-6-phosphate isomerase
MSINSLLSSDLKSAVFKEVEGYLSKEGFIIVNIDKSRPWGGFFVLDESQIEKFQAVYFPDVKLSTEQLSQKLSPKFLVVAPGARLSWQYHHRRSELWQLIFGEAGLIRSQTDEETRLEVMGLNQTISLQTGERHRLVGMGNWGVVAEIWVHSVPSNPSDEDDIVRLADDYARA